MTDMKTRWIAAILATCLAFSTDLSAQQGPGTGTGSQTNTRSQSGTRTNTRTSQPQAPTRNGGATNPGTGSGTGSQQRGGQGPGTQQGGQGTGTNLPTTLDPAVQSALQNMIAFELQAKEFYLAAEQAFGLRCFTKMAAAEQAHADTLARILTAVGATPVMIPGPTITLPPDVAGTLAQGILIEQNLIAGCTTLINDPLAAAIVPMLTSIRAADARHLVTCGG
jgi:hypothetical protein